MKLDPVCSWVGLSLILGCHQPRWDPRGWHDGGGNLTRSAYPPTLELKSTNIFCSFKRKTGFIKLPDNWLIYSRVWYTLRYSKIYFKNLPYLNRNWNGFFLSLSCNMIGNSKVIWIEDKNKNAKDAVVQMNLIRKMGKKWKYCRP